MLPDPVIDQTPEQFETASHRAKRLAAVETATAAVVAYSHRYDADEHIAEHEHGRAQLLHPRSGVVIVTTRAGRWMVPPDHALWIPARERHAVDTIGMVEMQSAYVDPAALSSLPAHLHVTGLTSLLRALMNEAVRIGPDPVGERAELIHAALLHEIPLLPERPLGLPLPFHPRLGRLCRDFIASPSARLEIDDWAARAGMSRRTFTRIFRQQTGLSLSAWRQQACVMAALPRLAAGDPVTIVGLDLGYDSMPAFTTMFSRVMGAPPKTYFRKQKAA